MKGQSKRVIQKFLSKFTVTFDDGLNLVEIEAHSGETLLDVLRKSGKPVHAPCGGKGTCEKCSVEISGVGSRLACQFVIDSDIRVLLPGFRQYTILTTQSSHARRIKNDSGIEVVHRNGSKIVFYHGQKLFAERVEAGDSNDAYGLAIDIGTTTVVIFLENLATFQMVDVASFVNPQSAYGGDVISRITFCIEQPDGLLTLQQKLIERINQTIEHLCQKNDILPRQIYKTTVVGNTVMLHIFCRVDPRCIAFAPFTPVFVQRKQMTAQALNLQAHPKGVVEILPSLAGYVGADIVAGLATTDVLEREEFILYIDIGTNGEIVLGNKDSVYCCATAAGPAFEGATIECGLGGVEGAISEYEDGEFTTIGGKPPIGICGSGLIDIVAALLDKNLIDQTGFMEKDFLLAPKKFTAINRDIVLTPQDVRQVQLAKAAIYAGIVTLANVAKISLDQIGRLYLAGGFGNYIRVESAIRIGLIPQELKGKIFPIGNSAGVGARFALKSVHFDDDIQRVLDKSEYIELSNRTDFNETFVEAMMFQ